MQLQKRTLIQKRLESAEKDAPAGISDSVAAPTTTEFDRLLKAAGVQAKNEESTPKPAVRE